MNSHYALDKTNARLWGVCAGLANRTGIDPTGIRILAVLSVLILGPVALFAYLVTALIAPNG